jgi:hypothetical protein
MRYRLGRVVYSGVELPAAADHALAMLAPWPLSGTLDGQRGLSARDDWWRARVVQWVTPGPGAAERGRSLEQDIGAAEYRGRYFGAAARRMRGHEFYRVALARVSRTGGLTS